MHRINSKLREKGKKEEGKRLREFVDAAYRFDPRVIRRKEEEKAERERKKREKEEAKLKAIQEEERIKAEAEAKQKAEQEEKARVAAEAKKAREAEKRLVKIERKRLRALNDAGGGHHLIPEDDLERICLTLDLSGLQQLCEQVTADSLDRQQQREILLDQLDGLDQRKQDQERAKEQQKQVAAAALKVRCCNWNLCCVAEQQQVDASMWPCIVYLSTRHIAADLYCSLCLAAFRINNTSATETNPLLLLTGVHS